MLLQLLANGFITGCEYALIALGFALIYNTIRVFHFAHGALYTLAVYLFYSLFVGLKLPVWLAALLSIAVSIVAGPLIDELIYAPLDKRSASSLIQMLSSLGVYIVIVNLIAMFYGNETKVLLPGVQPTFKLGGIILTRIQVIVFIAFIIIFFLLHFLLKNSNLGILIRAMRDNPQLVSVMGINPRPIRWSAMAIGTGLAGAAAILSGLDVGIDPNIGMTAFLNGAVAVIIGGIGRFETAAFGGLMLGLIQSLVIWQASARWQDMITFLILVFFLLFKPEGIFGVRRRVEESSL